MRALKPLLTRWLQLQCQMLHQCSHGLLVQFQDKTKPTVVAVWPEGAGFEQPVIDTAREVLQKQRLHLNEQNAGGIYLGYPVRIRDNFWGALVLQLDRNDPETMKAVTKLLDWGLNWLQFIVHDYSSYQQPDALAGDNEGAGTANTPQHTSPIASGSVAAVNLLTSVLRESSSEEAAIATVNFLAAQFNQDRVTLGLLRNQRIRLSAVSFAAHFDERSAPMQNIAEAMQEAADQNANIHCTAVLSPQADSQSQEPDSVIRLNHERMLDAHQLRSCQTFLLREKNQLIGAITLENAKAADNDQAVSHFVDNISPSLASVFKLKNDASTGIATLIKRKLVGTLQQLLNTRHPVESLFFACLVAFFIALFIPARFHISNDAVVESKNKHLVVSPYEGFLGAIEVRPGDLVTKDQLLAQLKDDDLNLERRKLSSQLQQYRLEYDNALANGNRAQAAILNAQVEQSRIELRLVEQKLQRVKLTSPISGLIVSDDISQQLGAPVTQGQVLFEIADSSDYRVALYVDERNVAYLQRQQSGTLSLKSLPGQTLPLTITRITPLSEIRNGRNLFRVDAELAELPEALRPGMTGRARVTIDRRALGWIWFHGLWNWVRLQLWI